MVNLCSVPNCRREANTRGWCKPHYDAFLRTGDPATYRGDRSHLTVWERIQEIGWTRKEATGCMEWNGYRNDNGYGQFRAGRGPLLRVHRAAYEALVGPLAARDQVLHTCDNPACSEPAHLRKGGYLENMRDMRAKGRGYRDGSTECPNGHTYPPESMPGSTKNRCRECARERNRRYHARKVAASR